MANNQMIICKYCGAEIAKSAKTCPNCGAKNKKPIYKRVWFIILVLIVVFGIIGAAIGGGDDTSTSEDPASSDQIAAEEGGGASGDAESGEAKAASVEYEDVTADQMMADLESNAAVAKDTYEGKYFAVSGKLGNIDSDGAYFDVMPDDEFAFIGVTCNIQSDDQLDQIKGMSKDDSITVKGKVTDVGEVIGYYLDIDEIE